jgi:hypothetical protein
MTLPFMVRNHLLVSAILFGALAWLGARSDPLSERRFDGFNIIAVPGHPLGSDTAKLSLTNARNLGARAVAIVPFLWQSSPSSADLVRGDDMDDAQLRLAIHDAHALGLMVLIKPHVWIPHSWAGEAAMITQDAWTDWFANYRRELIHIARIAEDEKAEALAIGTELTATSLRSEWNELIDATRRAFSGRLLYVAHNVEEAETVPFWDRLDAVGVSLYPPLGIDNDRDFRRKTMRGIADRLDALAARTGKSILVGEIGLRSAEGAAAKPWESAEERVTAPDPKLQADVLRDWLAALNRPAIGGVLIWRWLTDPDAGGLTDTDFTVQGKPAEHVLMCIWTGECAQDDSDVRMP